PPPAAPLSPTDWLVGTSAAEGFDIGQAPIVISDDDEDSVSEGLQVFHSPLLPIKKPGQELGQAEPEQTREQLLQQLEALQARHANQLNALLIKCILEPSENNSEKLKQLEQQQNKEVYSLELQLANTRNQEQKFSLVASQLPQTLPANVAPSLAPASSAPKLSKKRRYVRNLSKGHTYKKDEQGSYVCELCPYTVRNGTSMSIHYANEHTDKPKPTCPTCEKVFPKPYNLRRHLETSTKCNSSGNLVAALRQSQAQESAGEENGDGDEKEIDFFSLVGKKAKIYHCTAEGCPERGEKFTQTEIKQHCKEQHGIPEEEIKLENFRIPKVAGGGTKPS
ncbi:MAG: C2H2-type zinc finger protein, partial [Proteobacteria bacterium]|nr:C2H2-type zinc finger protein [Pseudomonadota bacterium]